jgi:LysR family transcriptional regulator (chromosome initiation inhibitor)
MELNPSQLDALVAIAACGSFEAAARQLHITPSAVSQRIRALEISVGQVLVSRGTPCVPTPRGERLVQLGRQTRLLYDEARQELGAVTSVELPVAVNADSLGTWFRDVLAEASDWEATAVLLHVEDQAYSQDLLRRGDALAAVTSDPVAVQGCTVEPLGAMRYVPAATPAFAERWRRDDDRLDWAAMPMLVFNDKDDLQHRQLGSRQLEGREPGGRELEGWVPSVVHRVPSTSDFYEAARLGLGWGMLPELQARSDLDAGRLVLLSGDAIDVPLHWQHWRIDSPRLVKLTEAVRRAARSHLRPPVA